MKGKSLVVKLYVPFGLNYVYYLVKNKRVLIKLFVSVSCSVFYLSLNEAHMQKNKNKNKISGMSLERKSSKSH